MSSSMSAGMNSSDGLGWLQAEGCWSKQSPVPQNGSVPSPPENGTFVVEGSIEVIAARVVACGMLDQMASPRVASPWKA